MDIRFRAHSGHTAGLMIRHLRRVVGMETKMGMRTGELAVHEPKYADNEAVYIRP